MAKNRPKVLGVLAGEDMPLAALREWADSADLVIAADSAADRLLACGARVDILVGDLDSVTHQGMASAGETVRVEEQDSTDCDKLLRLAVKRGYEKITLASIEGSQPDHVLATLHSALRASLHVTLAYRRGIGRLLKGGEDLRMDVMPGERISLLPLSNCRNVSLTGVRWEVKGQDFDASAASSISNEAVGESLHVVIGEGSALLYRECGPKPTWQ